MSAKSLRDRILQAEDIKPEPVEIPEWGLGKEQGHPVFLRPLDGDDRWRISRLAADADRTKQNIYITEAYVSLALVDENGERLIPFEDRRLLAQKNPLVLDRLFNRIVEISGMRAQDEVDAEKK